MRLREKRQEAIRNLNRTAIYEAAVELFKKYGFDGFTMQQVAKRAGMAIGTFYNYFTSKEQIINYVGDSLFADFYSSEVKATKEGCAIKKIEQFTRHFFEYRVRNRSLVKFFQQTAGNPEINPHRKEKIESLVKMVQEIIKEGIAKGEMAKMDAHRAATYIVSILIGYNNYFTENQGFDWEKESKYIVQFLKPLLAGGR